MGHTRFQRRDQFQGFISENCESVKSLGSKLHFFSTCLGQSKFHEFSNFLFIFMLSFSKTFQDNLNYTSTPNIQKVMRFRVYLIDPSESVESENSRLGRKRRKESKKIRIPKTADFSRVTLATFKSLLL